MLLLPSLHTASITSSAAARNYYCCTGCAAVLLRYVLWCCTVVFAARNVEYTWCSTQGVGGFSLFSSVFVVFADDDAAFVDHPPPLARSVDRVVACAPPLLLHITG